MKINIYFLMGLMIGGIGTAYADDDMDTTMYQDNESLVGFKNQRSSHPRRGKCGLGRIFCSENRSLEEWYKDMRHPLMRLEQALNKKAKSDHSAKEAKHNLGEFMIKMGDLLRIKADSHLHLDRNLSADEIQERTTKHIKKIYDQYERELPDVFGQILSLYFDLPFSQFCSSDDIGKSVRFQNALDDMYQQMWNLIEVIEKMRGDHETPHAHDDTAGLDEGQADHGAYAMEIAAPANPDTKKEDHTAEQEEGDAPKASGGQETEDKEKSKED